MRTLKERLEDSHYCLISGGYPLVVVPAENEYLGGGCELMGVIAKRPVTVSLPRPGSRTGWPVAPQLFDDAYLGEDLYGTGLIDDPCVHAAGCAGLPVSR